VCFGVCAKNRNVSAIDIENQRQVVQIVIWFCRDSVKTVKDGSAPHICECVAIPFRFVAEIDENGHGHWAVGTLSDAQSH